MRAITYYLLFPFIKVLSVLPFSLVYKISDILFFFIYYVFRYRREVVWENIRKSFPKKTEKEIKQIVSGYYSHMTDLLIESFMPLSKGKTALMERVIYKDTGALDKCFAARKNVILLAAHNGNWEWVGITMCLEMDYTNVIVYKPLSNPYFDRMFCNLRTKLGSKVVPMKNTFRAMVDNKNILTTTVLNADQSPAGMDNAIWVDFLGRETAFFNGAEKLAKKFDYPVVYIHASKTKRGYYEVTYDLLCDNPKATKDGEITQIFASRLEREIRRQPETWLWSHRRWKHKKQNIEDIEPTTRELSIGQS